MPLLKKTPATVVEVSIAAAEKAAMSVLTSEQTAQVEATKKTIAKAAAKASPNETMSKAEWASKDRRISRQGLFQAALQSVGLLQLNTGNTFEDYMTLVEQTAERGLQFVSKE